MDDNSPIAEFRSLLPPGNQMDIVSIGRQCRALRAKKRDRRRPNVLSRDDTRETVGPFFFP